MGQIIQLFPDKPPDDKTESPPLSPAASTNITLEQLTQGIGIALLVTSDQEAVKFFLSKFNQAVNCSKFDVSFSYHEVTKFSQYLGRDYSPLYQDLSLKLLHAYYSS